MKLEALAVVGASYGIAALAGGIAQEIAPAAPADLFWPALGGAAIAGLRTVLPAFSHKSSEPPSAVAIRACLSLTAGFLTAFYGTEWILSGLSENLRPPLPLAAIAIAALGEFSLSMTTEIAQKAVGARAAARAAEANGGSAPPGAEKPGEAKGGSAPPGAEKPGEARKGDDQ